MSYIYFGVCLATMFGSIIYEYYRLRNEESKLRETMKSLAEQTRAEMKLTSNSFQLSHLA